MDENLLANENEQNTPINDTAENDKTNKDMTPKLLSMNELICESHPWDQRFSAKRVSQLSAKQQDPGTARLVQSESPWMPQQFKDDWIKFMFMLTSSKATRCALNLATSCCFSHTIDRDRRICVTNSTPRTSPYCKNRNNGMDYLMR